MKSDKLICVSQAVAQTVLGGIPSKAKVIYNGVKQPGRVKSPVMPSTPLRIGVVGILDIAKQQHRAIQFMPEIIKHVPNVTLHIVGDRKCAYKSMLKRLVRELNLENTVVFEGFVEDTEAIYDKFDVLLMCSRAEAFGRVTIEAMLRQVPVIGFDAGGTSELIEDGVTGFKFVDCKDVIHALERLQREPGLWEHIVKKAREVAIDKFNEERYVSDVYKFVME